MTDPIVLTSHAVVALIFIGIDNRRAQRNQNGFVRLPLWYPPLLATVSVRFRVLPFPKRADDYWHTCLVRAVCWPDSVVGLTCPPFMYQCE